MWQFRVNQNNGQHSSLIDYASGILHVLHICHGAEYCIIRLFDSGLPQPLRSRRKSALHFLFVVIPIGVGGKWKPIIMTTYYRPEWTCGRYNDRMQTAIMYNLIEGTSFFFESYSALVVGEILAVPRNGHIDIDTIAEHTGIAAESIVEFAENLIDAGLVCNRLFSKEEIRALRIQQGRIVKEQPPQYNFKTDGQIAVSTAEEDYQNSLNCDECIPTVMFELTYNCSERCIHCYNAGATRNDCEVSGRNRNEITLDDYKRIIDELYELGTYKVTLTGGDPFSKPDAWDIIDYLYQKGIAFDIFTNGQAIADKTERLAAYYPRLVGLSVYSGCPEIHDRITRTKGSLNKTLSVAAQLSEHGVPMAFKCVVFRTNVKSYHTVKPLARKYGAALQIEMNLCDGVDGDTSITNHLRLPAEALEVLLRDPDVPMYIGKDRPNYGNEMKSADAYPCRAGIENLNITPDGLVTPCCTFSMPLGDIRKESMCGILHGDAVAKWRAVRVGDMEECGRRPECGYCYLCAGNNYLEHGTPLKASQVSCYMAKIRYGVVQKLKAGIDPLQSKSAEERLNEMDIADAGVFGKEIKH